MKQTKNKGGRPKQEPTEVIRIPTAVAPYVKTLIKDYKIARKNGITSVTIGEVTISAEVDTKGKTKKEIINEVYKATR